MSTLDNLHIITVTHHTLNVDQIGYFLLPGEKSEHEQRLHALKAEFQITELVYLATCNRVTYIMYGDFEINLAYLKSFFAFINPDLPSERLDKLPKFANVYSGQGAVNHLFEVVSSIDSLVVGEREIFRQFRDAFRDCQKMGLVGDYLRLLNNHCVLAAKSVYANTKIGEKPLSVASLAMRHILNRGINRKDRVLLVGAGETNTLMGKFLNKHQFENITIFNRSLDNAEDLSKLLHAESYHLSDLANYERGFDVMIVCTGATEAIIDTTIYQSLVKRDDGQKIVVDLSVPRNVEEEVVQNFAVDYIDIEQFRSLAEQNLECRKKEVVVARRILKEKLAEFHKVYQQRQIEKALHHIPTQVRQVKERALNLVYKKQMEKMDDETRSLILDMMNYMEKKCVSIPMKVAKGVAQ